MDDEAVLREKVSTSFATCMRLAVKLHPRLRETFPTLNELMFPLYTREQITGWPLSAQLDEWDVRHAFLQALEETSEESRGCVGGTMVDTPSLTLNEGEDQGRKGPRATRRVGKDRNTGVTGPPSLAPCPHRSDRTPQQDALGKPRGGARAIKRGATTQVDHAAQEPRAKKIKPAFYKKGKTVQWSDLCQYAADSAPKFGN